MIKNYNKIFISFSIIVLVLLKNILFTPSLEISAQEFDNIFNYSNSNQIHTLDWVREYIPVPLSASADYIKAITKDYSNNIYIVGDCYINANQIVLITIKVNSQGKIEWISRYDSKYDSKVFAKDIGVDNDDNIYVCGYTKGSHGSYDYIIIKYNSLGFQIWERYFNGPSNNYDEPVDMKVDETGNVYVTGICYLNEYNCNIATVKINKFGNLVYSIIYDGIKQNNDYPTGLVIDSKGNVYITGFSEGLNTGYDFIAIKYDTLGREVWNFRYNSNLNNDDYSKFIAIDKNGNVYISGISEGEKVKTVTIKLNNNGEVQWIASYNSEESYNVDVADMAIDYSGNIIIAVRIYIISNLPSAMMIKYNSNGKLIWIREYNNVNHNNYEPIALTIDEYNNIFLSGSTTSAETSTDILTMKCDTNGYVQWLRIYNNRENNIDEPVGIVFNGSGGVCIAGLSKYYSSYEDFLLISYNITGFMEWEIIQNIAGGGLASVDDIAIDRFGNIYIVAKEMKRDSSYSYVTIKYNERGNLQWINKFDAGKIVHNYKISIALDSALNTYIAGTVESNESSSDIILIKYNSLGECKWMRKYNGNDNLGDIAVSISVDKNQNIYVLGKSKTFYRSFDFITIKYNQEGSIIWQKSFGSTGNVDDIPADMCLDNFGNVYITGESRQYESYSTILTISYNTHGELNWITNFGVIGRNLPVAIVCDNKGYVYITGYSFNNQRGYDYVTLKYSILNGTLLWQKFYNGTANGDDYPSNIVVDSFGNVYVTGRSLWKNTRYDIVTIKYNSSGIEQWLHRYNGSGNLDDVPKSLSLDLNEDLFVTGLTYITIMPQTVTIQIGKFGNEKSRIFYSDNKSNKVEPVKILIDPQDNPVLCVNEYIFEWSKFSTIKYKDTLTTKIYDEDRQSNVQLKVFPNPFNSFTNVHYSLKENSNVEISIYDIRGRLIRKLISEWLPCGEYHIIWNAKNHFDKIVSSGIYILQLKTDFYILHKKLIVIK